MKNKKWLLLLIIALPSLLWIILETSTINSKKLPYYGPKTPAQNNIDTNYYSAILNFYEDDLQTSLATLNNHEFPILALAFIKSSYISDSYRIAGLWEYLNYKEDKIKHLPFVLVAENFGGSVPVKDSLKTIALKNNVKFLNINNFKFDSVNKSFFVNKPVYIDYSFFILLDENRNIRGYYDGRFVAEIKRLIEEFKHLRLKEAKKELIKDNEIKTSN